jgi:lipoyl(octanoyl) transferase
VSGESSENSFSGNGKWEFIDSGFRSGIYNMEFDMNLVKRCREEDTSFLRFYRWKPYALSLGYNQGRFANEVNIDYKKCSAEGLDVVTRPTGGRAVLHSEELTYSVVFRSKKPIRDLYRDISLAILHGLKTLGPEFKRLSFAHETPDILKLIKTGMYNLCFNSSVKYEINFKGRKLVGSAQRKFGDIVLQHGSILIGNHHRNIVNYLNITGEERVKMLREIEYKTICLNDIAKKQVDYKDVSEAVFGGFRNNFGIIFNSVNRVAEFVESRMKADLIIN